MIRSVDESLQRLNVDYVDLIQCHDIEFGSLAQVVSETIPPLRKVREQERRASSASPAAAQDIPHRARSIEAIRSCHIVITH